MRGRNGWREDGGGRQRGRDTGAHGAGAPDTTDAGPPSDGTPRAARA